VSTLVLYFAADLFRKSLHCTGVCLESFCTLFLCIVNMYILCRHMSAVLMQLQHVVSHSKGVRAKQQLLLLVLHPFSGLFHRITLVRQCQKCKASLHLNEARDDGVLGWQWHQLDHMQTICTSLQTHNHTNTSSFHFYRPDALPDAKPTASKH